METQRMKTRVSLWLLLGSALSLAAPALGEETVVEEHYKHESYRSGAAAMPTASPAPARVMERHESRTTVEQNVPPPPPPPVVEKRTEETIRTEE
jgi:hypothetical protein